MQQSGSARDNIPLIYDIGRLDPNGGVLAHFTCWRPRLGDPNPEQPGEKLFIKYVVPLDTSPELSTFSLGVPDEIFRKEI